LLNVVPNLFAEIFFLSSFVLGLSIFFIKRYRPYEISESCENKDLSWDIINTYVPFWYSHAALLLALFLYTNTDNIGYLVISLLVSISRVILGINYTSDVLIGMSSGILSFNVYQQLVKKVMYRQSKKLVFKLPYLLKNMLY
jgi:membrane-associated phospholipid phosphatase